MGFTLRGFGLGRFFASLFLCGTCLDFVLFRFEREDVLRLVVDCGYFRANCVRSYLLQVYGLNWDEYCRWGG